MALDSQSVTIYVSWFLSEATLLIVKGEHQLVAWIDDIVWIELGVNLFTPYSEINEFIPFWVDTFYLTGHINRSVLFNNTFSIAYPFLLVYFLIFLYILCVHPNVGAWGVVIIIIIDSGSLAFFANLLFSFFVPNYEYILWIDIQL